MRFGFVTAAAFLLMGALAPGVQAGDQPCAAGCGLQVKACAQSARSAMLSCKMDCRTNAAPGGLGACMLGCRDTFRSDRGGCRGDLSDCIGSCIPPTPAPPPTGCAAGCGQALGTCAQGVVTQAKTCLAGCRTAADRLSCLVACATAARQGAAACATQFRTCLGGCGVPPPPTPCLLSGPACGGACPFGLVCQPPPPGSMIALACLCRRPTSPSGAFIDGAAPF